MRIVVNTIEEFIEHLKSSKGIFDNTIFKSINRNSASDKKPCVKFSVNIQTSVVVETEEGQYIMESGEFCGYDYEDATKEVEGTTKCQLLDQSITEFAKFRGWKVLPGMISE